jgi:hypothetical protein
MIALTILVVIILAAWLILSARVCGDDDYDGPVYPAPDDPEEGHEKPAE